MNLLQIEHFNPGYDEPLIVPVLVLPNTPEEVGDAQIKANSALDLPWLYGSEPHDGVAVMCGGGPSLKDNLSGIAEWQMWGAKIFALNGAAQFLRKEGINPDFQVIVDPKQETSTLVEPRVGQTLLASQVHPSTVEAASRVTLFHMANRDIQDLFPPERVEAGGYTLIGGGVSCGITALCLAHAMGYRAMHLYGYDSSHAKGQSHAYAQPMNALMPMINVTWGGEVYSASMPMKIQAFAFPQFARALMEDGVKIEVHGSGLLPAIWSVPPASEREKYSLLWMTDDYRVYSPGEDTVPTFLDVAKPDGSVIDFGCGTGRAARAIQTITGQKVLCIDFTDNCRDKANLVLEFLQWDITKPIPAWAEYGFCTDVMEHIAPENVDAVIGNIMASAPRVFFKISTRDDFIGPALIGSPLHLTVRPHEWWLERFSEYQVQWQDEGEMTSCFYIIRKDP